MAVESVNYQCLACGGALHLDPGSGKLRCEYCESEFDPAQVEAAYAAEQAEQDAEAEAATQRAEAGDRSEFEQMGDIDGASSALTQKVIDEAVATSSSKDDPIQGYLSRAAWNEDERQGMRSFTCSSCGAGLTVDASTAVTECPYCGNAAVVAGTFSKDARPDYVIPFKMEKQAAVEALAAHYKGKKFLPSEFASANRVEHVQGVYVPFWLYDGTAEGGGSFLAKKIRTYTLGDYRVTETEEWRAYREGCLSFERVPVDCSDKMPDGHMDAIEPFDFSEMKPFSVAYMPGYMAERYDQTPGECQPRADKRMRNSLEDELRSTVTGYTEVGSGDIVSDVKWTGLVQTLIPVWMMHTRWKDKDYLFAMNGQTGRMVGDLPVSKAKVAIWFLAIFAVLAAALVCLDYFALQFDDITTSVLVDGGVPLLVSAITCWVFYSQMKTAREQTDAEGYITAEGLNLTGRSDIFIRRYETRVKIRNDD